jgi:GTPase SAR1 family protein
MEVDLLAPLSFPPGPKPREAAEWLGRFETETDLRDHMMRILEEQSPAAQLAKEKVAKYVAAEILPALQSGSALVKKRSDIEDVFSPKCDLCEKFLAALGGEVPSDKLDTTSPAAALNCMLSKAAPHEPSAAKSDQERLKSLLEAGGCQSEAMAELVLERLQAHMQALRVGIDDCRALGDPEKPYEDASADAANLHAVLRKQLADKSWRPLKLSDSIETEHGSLIRSVDKLYDEFRDEFQQLKLKFPEVIVVGSESVGKSSLLEKIAGMAFFPRGENVTTRLGFRLRLHHCTPKEMDERKKGRVAVSVSGKEVLMRFDDEPEYMASVEQARARVEAENAKVQALRVGVVDREIILNLYSNDFPELTLLDLPGIIRARGPNDPEDIHKTCEKIVRSKIRNPDAIILAVLNAREGIRGAAEGIRLVQEEKAERRTLAVLTCIDRCDHADDIAAVMRQEKDRELPRLGHHYHACIGRDTKRNAAGERAAPDDNAAFLAAISATPIDMPAAELLLRGDRVSEAVLAAALTDVDKRATTAAQPAAELEGMRATIRAKLEETGPTRTSSRHATSRRRRRARLPALSRASKWSGRLIRVCWTLRLGPTLDLAPSRALSERLSQLLTEHISNVWSPKMRKMIAKKQEDVQRRISACGVEPPTEDATARAAFATQLVQATLGLLNQKQILKDSVGALVARVSGTMKWDQCASDARTALGTRALDFGKVGATVTTAPFLTAVEVALQTTNKEHPLHLRRFTFFAQWLKHAFGAEVSRRQELIRVDLENLLTALAPEVKVVDDEFQEPKLCRALIDTLPRLIHRHLGSSFFAALPGMLKPPPAELKLLVVESEKHVELREHKKRLHKALEEVSKELVRYGDGPPRPEPNADHLCPISRELMREPVTASDGHVYERASIERWIKEKTKGNKTVPVRSPKTGEPLESIKLIPAHMVRSQIIEWLEKYGIKDEPED